MFQNGAMAFGLLYMIMTLLSLFNLTVYMQLDNRFPDPVYVLPISIMVSYLSELCENFRKRYFLAFLSQLLFLFFHLFFSLSSFSF